jgi:hypothetical protein
MIGVLIRPHGHGLEVGVLFLMIPDLFPNIDTPTTIQFSRYVLSYLFASLCVIGAVTSCLPLLICVAASVKCREKFKEYVIACTLRIQSPVLTPALY